MKTPEEWAAEIYAMAMDYSISQRVLEDIIREIIWEAKHG